MGSNVCPESEDTHIYEAITPILKTALPGIAFLSKWGKNMYQKPETALRKGGHGFISALCMDFYKSLSWKKLLNESISVSSSLLPHTHAFVF